MSVSQKVLYCPHGGKPHIHQGTPKKFSGDEYLVISPTLTVFYNITKNTPNAKLSKIGGILSNIPGDAIIVCEDEKDIKDIPEVWINRASGDSNSGSSTSHGDRNISVSGKS